MASEKRLAVLNKRCAFHPLFNTDFNKVENRLKEKLLLIKLLQ